MKRLSREPSVHATAVVEDSSLGTWTEIGQFTTLENVIFGDYSYTGQWCIVQNAVVGKFSNIAAAVRIGPTMHPVDRPTLHHFTYRRAMYGMDTVDDGEFFARRRSATTRIGHDTWLGHGAIVMPGVRIGDGSVVGAGAVVTHDIPPYTIAAGVPARVLRPRFAQTVGEALQGIAWWDWDDELIRERLADFLLPAHRFVEKYGRRAPR
jgi:hypothetical protein